MEFIVLLEVHTKVVLGRDNDKSKQHNLVERVKLQQAGELPIDHTAFCVSKVSWCQSFFLFSWSLLPF